MYVSLNLTLSLLDWVMVRWPIIFICTCGPCNCVFTPPPWGGEVTPYNGLYGKALPWRVTFLSLQVNEMLGISLADVYECVGKYVISSVKRLKRTNRCILRQWKSWVNVLVLWFIYDILKTVYLQLLKGMQSSTLSVWKGYHLSIEGIRKGGLLCQKRYLTG